MPSGSFCGDSGILTPGSGHEGQKTFRREGNRVGRREARSKVAPDQRLSWNMSHSREHLRNDLYRGPIKRQLESQIKADAYWGEPCNNIVCEPAKTLDKIECTTF